MSQRAGAAEEFEAFRTRLVGLGYRMLGSRAEAEDLVQETYLRWHRTPRDEIQDPAPWLHTTMTRLCIDALRVRQREQGHYIGPWLPEPWVTPAPEDDDMERALELADDLSVAFLLLLERLAPEERAAFLLHDVFESSYRDIAELLDKSEVAARQIVSRARGRVAGERRRFHPSRRQQEELAERFRKAVESRDEATLLALFQPDATLVSDGGGKVAAALRPILGAGKIVRFFLGITRHIDPHSVQMEPCWINDAPAMVIREAGGSVMATFALAVGDGRITNIYAVRNPDKLTGFAVPWEISAPGHSHPPSDGAIVATRQNKQEGAMPNRHGDFIWYELLAEDPDEAERFYGDIFGWHAMDSGQPGQQYRILQSRDDASGTAHAIGGLLGLDEDMKAGGAKPVWLGYIGVSDVDAAVRGVVEAGGSVLRSAWDVPGVGRMAMVADPQGVPFYVMRGASDEESLAFAHDRPRVGHCAWNELSTSDKAAAFEFYSSQFGWEKDGEMDMGPLGTYEFLRHGGMIGALMTKPADAPVPMWNHYFRVADIDVAADKILAGGGRILQGPDEIPGGEFTINAEDPQGAPFSLIGVRP